MDSEKTSFTPLDLSGFNQTGLSWKMKDLLKRALKRLKERFLTYLGSLLAGLIIFVIVNLILVGIILILSSLPNVPVLNIINFLFRAVIVIILLPINLYLFVWLGLVLTNILIQEPRQALKKTLQSTQPLVGGFVRYSIGFFLFMLFLIPLNFVLTTFFFIPVISIIWTFWSTFAIFIYLQKHKKGLENLWASYNTINQKLWRIAWRKLIISIIFSLLIIAPIALLVGLTLFKKVAGDSGLGFGLILFWTIPVLISIPLSFLFGIFTTSFDYELYRLLPEPRSSTKPIVWIWAGIIGIILSIVLLIYFPKLTPSSFLNYFYKNSKLSQNSPAKQSQTEEPINFKQVFVPYTNRAYNYKLNYPSIYFIDGKKINVVPSETKDKASVFFMDSTYKKPGHDIKKLGQFFPFFSIKILSKDTFQEISTESNGSQFTQQQKDILFSIPEGSSKAIETDDKIIASANTFTRLPNLKVGGETARVFENDQSWLQAQIENINQRFVFVEKNNYIYKFECLYLSTTQLKNFESVLAIFQFTDTLSPTLGPATPSATLTVSSSPMNNGSTSSTCPYSDCQQIKANLGKGCDSQDYFAKCK